MVFTFPKVVLLLFLSGFLGALFYLVGTFFDKQLHLNTSSSRSILASLKGLSRQSINDDDDNDDDNDHDDNDCKRQKIDVI